jgi:RNA polymerase sigma-70 factor, ECF subfamily
MPNQLNIADCVAQHLPFLNRSIRGIMHGNEAAEDVVQQTVLKALINADQFRFESALKTWLDSIAINEVRQAYRCRWHRCTVPLITEDVDLDRSWPLELPINHYEEKERDILVRNAVSRLPRTYRVVVELCDFQQLSLTEAARKLGLTLSAVKSRRHRARQKLLPIMRNLKLQSHLA